MAVTVESLKEEIVKISVELGVDDLEHIYGGQDFDIPTLKQELLIWKEKLKKHRDSAREEKKEIKGIRDFFVKLQRIFKEDSYIYNGKYIYPGISTESELPGSMLLDIQEEFRDIISPIFFKEMSKNTLIYIPSIDKAKKSLDVEGSSDDKKKALLDVVECDVEETDTGKEVIRNILTFLNEIENDRDGFITIPEQNDTDVFSIKKIFRLSYEDCPDVDMSLQLLPTVTEENLQLVEYVCRKRDDVGGDTSIYYIRIRIPYSYFELNIKYHYF